MEIAVLLTCHNRKKKTLSCLKSLFEAEIPADFRLTVFLVDDNSEDGTGTAVSIKYPAVHVLYGSGHLYWAGGMRLAWETAINYAQFDAFLLINDDVLLNQNFIHLMLEAEEYALINGGKKGLYSSSTSNNRYKDITYGGEKISNWYLYVKRVKLTPSLKPQKCDLTNANILWVSTDVVDAIGIFDKKFTHGIADYDYSLRAKKRGFPVLITSGIGGACINDHGVPWMSQHKPLKERIIYLKSPTDWLIMNTFII